MRECAQEGQGEGQGGGERAPPAPPPSHPRPRPRTSRCRFSASRCFMVRGSRREGAPPAPAASILLRLCMWECVGVCVCVLPCPFTTVLLLRPLPAAVVVHRCLPPAHLVTAAATAATLVRRERRCHARVPASGATSGARWRAAGCAEVRYLGWRVRTRVFASVHSSLPPCRTARRSSSSRPAACSRLHHRCTTHVWLTPQVGARLHGGVYTGNSSGVSWANTPLVRPDR